MWHMNHHQGQVTTIKALGSVGLVKLSFPTVCTSARSGVIGVAVVWTAFRYVAHQADWLHAVLIFIFMATGFSQYISQVSYA